MSPLTPLRASLLVLAAVVLLLLYARRPGEGDQAGPSDSSTRGDSPESAPEPAGDTEPPRATPRKAPERARARRPAEPAAMPPLAESDNEPDPPELGTVRGELVEAAP